MYEKKVTSVEDTRNAINIQSQINYAVQSVIKDLEIDGYVVPSVTVSVKGDTREVWSPEKHFIKIYYHYINFIESTYGLSITEKGIIYELTKYIDYESNWCDIVKW